MRQSPPAGRFLADRTGRVGAGFRIWAPESDQLGQHVDMPLDRPTCRAIPWCRLMPPRSSAPLCAIG